jgi:hypothetical protein
LVRGVCPSSRRGGPFQAVPSACRSVTTMGWRGVKMDPHNIPCKLILWVVSHKSWIDQKSQSPEFCPFWRDAQEGPFSRRTALWARLGYCHAGATWVRLCSPFHIISVPPSASEVRRIKRLRLLRDFFEAAEISHSQARPSVRERGRAWGRPASPCLRSGPHAVMPWVPWGCQRGTLGRVDQPVTTQAAQGMAGYAAGTVLLSLPASLAHARGPALPMPASGRYGGI